jgi:hypothetical protein
MRNGVGRSVGAAVGADVGVDVGCPFAAYSLPLPMMKTVATYVIIETMINTTAAIAKNAPVLPNILQILTAFLGPGRPVAAATLADLRLQQCLFFVSVPLPAGAFFNLILSSGFGRVLLSESNLTAQWFSFFFDGNCTVAS